MCVLPLDRNCQGVDRRAQTRHRRDQHRWQRAQRRHTLAQAREHRLEAAQIGDAVTFGASAQALAGTPFIGRPPGVEKQAGIADHALAHWSRGLLVVLEPALQLAGGQR
jgi:hypothetical protein